MARTGTGTITEGAGSVTVADGTVAANSMVTLVCTSDPGESAGGGVVEYITKDAGVGFTATFSSPFENETTYDYLIVTPRTGTGTIPAGADSVVVTAAGVAADSMIKVVLTSNPSEQAGGAEIERVTKDVGVGFTLGLTNAVQNTTTFDYLIV